MEVVSNETPRLFKVGILTYAGDDGGEKGQAYRLALDLDAGVARFRFRYPDEAGMWHWRKTDTIISLPDAVRERRQIDELKKKVATYEQQRDALPPEHPKRLWYNQRIALYRREIDLCWRKYEQRNRALAHLASNVLLLLARVHGCSLLSMESLKTLKSTGRGRG